MRTPFSKGDNVQLPAYPKAIGTVVEIGNSINGWIGAARVQWDRPRPRAGWYYMARLQPPVIAKE